MSRIAQRLDRLEGDTRYSTIGELLDALNDPAAMAALKVHPDLVRLLDSLDEVEQGHPTPLCNGGLPL